MEDEIHLAFRQAQVGDEYRFWNGEGYLQAPTGENQTLCIGTSEIRCHTSNLKFVNQDEERINLVSLQPGEFEIGFLTGRPNGHGYYLVDEILPKVNDQRHITLEIENGDRLVYSNLNWSVQKGGNIMTLECVTDQDHLQLLYLTKLANAAISNAIAAVLFLGFLLVYLLHRRKDVRSRINKNLKRAKKGDLLPFMYEQLDQGYRITYLRDKVAGDGCNASAKMEQQIEMMDRQIERQSESSSSCNRANPSVFIPTWLVSGLATMVLMIIFIRSLFSPIMPKWDQLGVLRYGVIVGGLGYAVLSMIFILSAGSQRELLARVGIIGGGIIWIMFSYLGGIALLLGGCAALLIYLLSILVVEGEDEINGDDSGL